MEKYNKKLFIDIIFFGLSLLAFGIFITFLFKAQNVNEWIFGGLISFFGLSFIFGHGIYNELKNKLNITVRKYNFIKYFHYREIWVREDLKGEFSKYCLCYNCSKFNIRDIDKNCPKAQKLYELCIEEDLTTPVFECVDFDENSN